MSESLNSTLSRCFMRFDDRAERLPPQQVIDTFASAGPLLDVLSNRSHQIIYGRRGVGKTHTLRYFEARANARNDIAIYIDCANIGSNNSTYNDKTLDVVERSSRLLIDVCLLMYSVFCDAFTDPRRRLSLSEVAPLLNDFTSAITETRIEGPIEEEHRSSTRRSTTEGTELGAAYSGAPKFSFKMEDSTENQQESASSQRVEGVKSTAINFQFLAARTADIARYIAPRRIWLLFDEWSTIPLDLQPVLADLIRRSFFGISNLSVKIAAIEQRSQFRRGDSNKGYQGIELGGDASVALNLDDYLVYEANAKRSTDVFRGLIRNHVASICREDGIVLDNDVYDNLTSHAFTQENVFVELVKASEGVPRDAMHILAGAAQRTPEVPISAPVLRASALKFFQTEKYSAIASNPAHRQMLDWIRFTVIDQRNTRAFLLPVGTNDRIIDSLFDLRALHILNRSMSAAHRPGERFVVYKIDYGCYVDLNNTAAFPQGGLVADDPTFEVDFSVPDDDARSYRRAILDLDDFYRSHGVERP